jgi:S1-C subfamily serine protease
MPQPAPLARPAPAAAGSSRLSKVVLGVVVVAALAFGGAVATGLLHVPGFDSGTSAPQMTSATPVSPQQVDDGDRSTGVRISTLTQDLAKARQLNTSRNAGVVVTEVIVNSPAQNAGIRANDIIVAIDGVPAREWTEYSTKVRLTPIGQQMGVTVERNGAVQDLSITVGRCLVREAPRPSGATLCLSFAQ